MTLTNRLGRPMLAAMFVTGGADQLIHPDEKADAAGPIVDEIDDKIDAVPMPSENRDAVRINGAVQLVAGGLLAMNRVPRLAATALAASLVPTTLAGHRFWRSTTNRPGRSNASTS
ncbi:MAG: DoxX family membrane protein [Acidimicrobiales bacterium]|nr:DoxX family membrane protein [Acidimicrobiales bacterium]